LTTAGALTLGTVAIKNHSDALELDPSPVGNGMVHRSGATADNINKHIWAWPDGAHGPVIMRAQSDDSRNQSDWTVLQNKEHNFYYDRETGVIQDNNHRAWNEHVMRLPTDRPEMIEFLATVDGYETRLTGGLSVRGEDWMISMVDGPNQPIKLETMLQRGVSGQNLFQADWQTDINVVDNRDQMHRQGWAYFKADGHIKGEHLSATGRLPFFYSTYKNHSPWIRLRVGSQTLVDTDSGAYAFDESSKALVRFRSGSFFKGFGRPWRGLHTIDTVRRDAAEQRVLFKTEIGEDRSTGTVELDLDPYTVVYTIDMNADLVHRIDIYEGKTGVGKMIFTYLASLPESGDSFGRPKPASRGMTHSGIGVDWISRLVSATLFD